MFVLLTRFKYCLNHLFGNESCISQRHHLYCATCQYLTLYYLHLQFVSPCSQSQCFVGDHYARNHQPNAIIVWMKALRYRNVNAFYISVVCKRQSWSENSGLLFSSPVSLYKTLKGGTVFYFFVLSLALSKLSYIFCRLVGF